MQLHSKYARFFLAGALFPCTPSALAQGLPDKPLRIVTSESAGGNDFVARLIAQALASNRPAIVDNRSGVMAAQVAAKALPDGHTMLLTTGTLWLLPLMQKVTYDTFRDFMPITLVGKSPNVVVVHPALPVKSIPDLIALARAKPGALNYGSASTGSAVHLAAELFNVMANVSIVRIPYKGSGPAVVALLGGEVQVMFATGASVAPHVKSGKLRSVAVTSASTSVLFPELPTVSASGLPGYESVVVIGMFAPSGVPEQTINRLNNDIVRVLARPEVRDTLLGVGIETVGSSPAQFAVTIKSEVGRMGKVIRDAGIHAD